MSDDAIQLRDQVAVLRRRWLVVVVTVAVTVGIGLLTSLLQTPAYDASTRVQLFVDPNSTNSSLTAEQVATEAEVVTDDGSLTQVITELGLADSEEQLLDTVVVEPDESGAAVLTISTTRDDGAEAAAIANQLADTYLKLAGAVSAARVDQIEAEVLQVNREITRLDQELAGNPPPRVLTRLRSDRAAAVIQRDELLATQAELSVGAAPGAVLRSASEPDEPSSPRPLRTAALAVVIGLLLGVGAAYLRDYFDDVVRDERQLRSSLPGIPVLGRIPHWKRSAATQPTTLRSPGDQVSEAYRAMGVNVRTLLDGWQPERPRSAKGRTSGRVVLVASAMPSEGKTATAVNLAVVTAQAGLAVVLVDADLRRPKVAELFELGDERGLADVLDGSATLRQGVADVGVDNLLVLPGGNGTAGAAELLASPRRGRLLEQLATEADLVIVDGSAVLGVADTLEVAKDADLTVLVVREASSRGREMAAALQRLEQVGATVAGLVVTDASKRRA